MCLTILWTLGVTETLDTILTRKGQLVNKNDKITTGDDTISSAKKLWR